MSVSGRPRVVISRCLGFDACRYDGRMVSFPFAEQLADHSDIVTVCPEMAIGLGVPRSPIQLYSGTGGVRLLQPGTETDLTDSMQAFSEEFLRTLPPVDGFLLKAKSPSCGFYDTKLFAAGDAFPEVLPIGTTAGLFAAAVRHQFPQLPLEDETRLQGAEQRHHFLTQVFTWARFRSAQKAGRVQALLEFQSENKYLLMAYHQVQQKVLGRITARASERAFSDAAADYARELAVALEKPPTPASYANAIMHCLGYFSDRLPSTEKQSFLKLLSRYREGWTVLREPLELLETYVERFDEGYLRKQTLLRPYPPSLTPAAASLPDGDESPVTQLE